ncbi:DUF3667 domain-containing protein [Tsuneonella amylolytica]|uniref:DUF3667 domain-containing protein n=1 Tax=Tsuneonella amylolytica TaxID=2338327 RepID=UPI000EA916ED|nr:DUF3667 domain-containing protein [Tsuneonella amylolytica]
MSGDFSEIATGLADAGTGATVSRAVEPEAGEDAGHTQEGACLNCSTTLVGSHCHACGQRAHVHRTVGAFFHDLLHGVLHFEGKTWRTIPLLVWQPGRLTREYIDGKRASYVSPIALFLFVVFLSFALFNALGGGSAPTVMPEGVGTEQARLAYDTNTKEIAELKAQLPDAAGAERERIEQSIASLEEDQEGLSSALEMSDDLAEGFRTGFEENPLPAGSTIAKAVEHVRENPQLAIYKAQTSAYKYSWMLIPLSVPFVWLLFPFSRRFRGYDHTVFVTYSITFMIALVAVVSLLFWFNLGSIGGLLLLYAPFHMYRQIRGTYGTTRAGAIVRMILLSAFAWIAIALFAGIIAMLVS